MHDRDSTCLCGCLGAPMGTAVGRLVVEVRADRLCRFAALALRLALMRATDLRVGYDGCLRPRRLDDAAAGPRPMS
jgi:hypothetical protein